MPTVQIDANVFNEAYKPYINDYTRTQIFFGGSGSGKSVALAQRAVLRLLQGRNQLICRAVARTIRKSVWNEIRSVIDNWGMRAEFTENKTELTITCRNGRQAIFAGLDDVEKLKSIRAEHGVLDDIWIEEATECKARDVSQLRKRQRGQGGGKKTLTLSFNPILKSHWIFEQYFKPLLWNDTQTEHRDKSLSILKTWHIHNRFLTDDDIDDLLNEPDEYMRSVYAFGNWGVLGNLILPNHEIIDTKPFVDQSTYPRYGLDFGYSQDPTCFIDCAIIGDDVYVFNEMYKRELTNADIYTELLPLIGSYPITADSAEPKSIEELNRLGLDVKGAKKGKNSVYHAIQWLRQRKIYIDKDCVNFAAEVGSWQWKADKYGEATNKPEDKNNHGFDALHYALEDDMNDDNWLML